VAGPLERQRALHKVAAKSLDALIEQLLELKRTRGDGQLPRVTLHLASGRQVSGWLLDAQGGQLLLHAAGEDPRQAGDDALYLPRAALEAITVHDAGALALQLDAERPPPSRLDLKRRAAELSAQVSQVVGEPVTFEIAWDAVMESGPPLRALEDLMLECADSLTAIGGDPLGRGALRERLRKVCFVEGPRAAAAMEGGTLIVCAHLTEGAAGRLDSAELRSAIEASL
jgi:antitoxin component of MazEF toxin-antitoxin module